MSKLVRILIADDHFIVRAGLRALISVEEGLQVYGEVSTAQEALELALKNEFDLLLLDIAMPGRPGFEILPILKANVPKLRTLVISAHPEKDYAERCLRAGANGYLCKSRTAEDLIPAVRKVADGGYFVSDSLAQILASKLSRPCSDPHEVLSDREFDVLTRLSAGKSTSEIARELSLSVKTVSTYRARLLSKLGLKSNSEIIRYGLSHLQ